MSNTNIAELTKIAELAQNAHELGSVGKWAEGIKRLNEILDLLPSNDPEANKIREMISDFYRFI